MDVDHGDGEAGHGDDLQHHLLDHLAVTLSEAQRHLDM